jgi:hypothetical protein
MHLDSQHILHCMFVRGLTIISLVGGLGVEGQEKFLSYSTDFFKWV